MIVALSLPHSWTIIFSPPSFSACPDPRGHRKRIWPKPQNQTFHSPFNGFIRAFLFQFLGWGGRKKKPKRWRLENTDYSLEKLSFPPGKSERGKKKMESKEFPVIRWFGVLEGNRNVIIGEKETLLEWGKKKKKFQSLENKQCEFFF